MEEKKIEMTVTCKDHETAVKYKELVEKMAKDKVFIEKIKECKDMKELYNLYKKYGYTDLDFEGFSKQLKTDVTNLGLIDSNKVTELTDQDLENIAGGFSFIKALCTIVSAVPIVGPVISGAVKAVQAGIDKGACAAVLEVGKGLGLGMVDAVAFIATAGASTAGSVGVKVGLAGIKGTFEQI